MKAFFKNKVSKGFTLVELAIVIAIISILAVTTVVAYSKVQMQSRDDKRANDMVTLGNLLEKYYNKYGSYPNGCSSDYCGNSYDIWYIGNDTFNKNSTLDELGETLGQNNLQTKDPKASASDTPFASNDWYSVPSTIPAYVYRGGASLNPGFAYVNQTNGVTKFQVGGSGPSCTVDVAMSSEPKNKSFSTYLLAYYSESTKSWKMYTGDHGAKPTITSASPASYCSFVN